jgi:hypothetical protein
MRYIGSKREVFNRSALRTAGGLRKRDLKMNKRGRIVSIKQSKAGTRTNNLGDYILDAKNFKKTRKR